MVGWLILALESISYPTSAAQPSLIPSVPKTTNSTAIASKPIIQETPYTLGAGDRLRVDVLNVPEYSGEQIILVDGTISLPIIGRIQAEGLTINELSQQISQKYGSYIKRAIASVTLLQPRPAKIAISGEVNNPGSYIIDITEQKQVPSVTGLVNLAGGLTTAANMRQIEIRRSFKGKEQLLTVDLSQLIQQANLSQDIVLRDGDRIFIPTKSNIDIAETNQIAYANFGLGTFKSLNVIVVGEVVSPGSYKVEREEDRNRATDVRETQKIQPPRLIQALQLAGGIKPLADIRNIEVRRLTRNGSQQTVKVDLWQLLQKGDINQDLILQEGDTIIIPSASAFNPNEAVSLAEASFAPNKIKVNVVGEVNKPGLVEVPPNTPLNQALLAAGGFDNQRAKKSSVELIRLNPNGSVSQRKIEVDLASGINEENNPSLRENDVIVVNRSGITAFSDTVGEALRPVGSVFSVTNLLRIFGLTN